MKCYSHDMVICAVYVWGCILEHHCTETWKDRNQFHMEPNRPVILRETREIGTDDVEGPIHCTISHNRLEVRDLPNYMIGFHHTVTMLKLYIQDARKDARKYWIWMCPLQLMQRFTCLNTECDPWKAQDCPSFPGVKVVYLSICCQLCQEFIHIFQSIVLLKFFKQTVDLVCVNQGPCAQCQLC